MPKTLPLTLLFLGAAAMAADAPMQQLAGRYTHRFKNGDVSGEVYYTTDVVEILPLDRSRALVNFDLNFFNGHSCSLAGVAKLAGARLVYRDDQPNSWSDEGCRLEIWRDRSRLRWTETDGTSCQSHCGARGGMSNGEISYGSRQTIGKARAKQMREDPESLIEH